MSLAVVHSRAQIGVQAPLVTVEVHCGGGLPSIGIVGLPEAAVKEARDRVRAALVNARFGFPLGRVTVSLAPADLPKEGGRFDLPIALGVLAAQGHVPAKALEGREFLGELALGGELRPVRGVLPAALQARRQGRTLVVPSDNGAEAALLSGADIRCADSLLQLCAWLRGEAELPRPEPEIDTLPLPVPDLADVRGQPRARRALEVAAAGGHNLLLVGPPGTGKTMLASRLPGILPEMDDEEALEAATVASVSGQGLDPRRWRQRPFRAPHHTASAAALVGGGSSPRPGELSLAHRGVLFLDELPEFSRHVLEVLREPLESGRIVISRAARQAEFPADVQLVAAMNPCPCGYAGDPSGRCQCTPDAILRYRSKISGPLLDRIDMLVEVPRMPREELRVGAAGRAEPSASVRTRVLAARRIQLERCGRLNARLTPADIERHCALDAAGHRLLDCAVERLGLSARAYHRVLKLARTLADLDGAERIGNPQLAEAIGYRRLDPG